MKMYTYLYILLGIYFQQIVFLEIRQKIIRNVINENFFKFISFHKHVSINSNLRLERVNRVLQMFNHYAGFEVECPQKEIIVAQVKM